MRTTKQVMENPYFTLEWNEAGDGLAAIRRCGGGMNYYSTNKLKFNFEFWDRHP